MCRGDKNSVRRSRGIIIRRERAAKIETIFQVIVIRHLLLQQVTSRCIIFKITVYATCRT